MRLFRNTTVVLIGIAFLIYLIAFGRMGGIKGLLFMFPFTMIPFVVTAYFAVVWRAIGSQVVLLAMTIAYAAWFTYIYVQATILHPDPQSPIAFLFVSIYALPALILLWILAWAIDWERKGRWST